MLTKIISKFLILSFLNISLFSKTPHELVNFISNSTMNVQYYFYIIKNNAFLSKKSPNGGYALWYYTIDRKWQPIHNAGAFDGFSKADSVFDSVEANEDNTKVTIGSIINTNISDKILSLAKQVENTDSKIGWYFWTTNGGAFLLKKRTDNTISIWHYTVDRKWQPIHNAESFDGFPAIKKTLDDIKFNSTTNTLELGDISNDFFDVDKLVPPTPAGLAF